MKSFPLLTIISHSSIFLVPRNSQQKNKEFCLQNNLTATTLEVFSFNSLAQLCMLKHAH